MLQETLVSTYPAGEGVTVRTFESLKTKLVLA